MLAIIPADTPAALARETGPERAVRPSALGLRLVDSRDGKASSSFQETRVEQISVVMAAMISADAMV